MRVVLLQSMNAAMTAVRIRSAAICKLLDVQDESRSVLFRGMGAERA